MAYNNLEHVKEVFRNNLRQRMHLNDFDLIANHLLTQLNNHIAQAYQTNAHPATPYENDLNFVDGFLLDRINSRNGNWANFLGYKIPPHPQP